VTVSLSTSPRDNRAKPRRRAGIALARRAGITVDYTSATVDTAGLSESLGVANIINAQKTALRRVATQSSEFSGQKPHGFVGKTLVTPDLSTNTFHSPVYSTSGRKCRGSDGDGPVARHAGCRHSFAGEFSDTQRLANHPQSASRHSRIATGQRSDSRTPGA